MVLHMKILKLVGIPLVLVSICGWLLHSAYLEVKNEAIGQLNRQQRVMARRRRGGSRVSLPIMASSWTTSPGKLRSSLWIHRVDGCCS